MATTSTVPAVKTALVSLLTSAINDSTVQVMYGKTPDHLAKRQAVVVTGPTSYASEIANLKSGRKQRDETYTITVLFLVGRPRGQSTVADARAWTLFAELEDILADDPQLGAIDGLAWAVLGGVEADVAQEKEGPVAWIAADVDCKARTV